MPTYSAQRFQDSEVYEVSRDSEHVMQQQVPTLGAMKEESTEVQEVQRESEHVMT